MKKTKLVFRKALSLLLCAMLVLSTVAIGLVSPSSLLTVANAAEDVGQLAFYAPEAVYLYPNVTSWTEETQTPFQYFITNTVDTSKIYSSSALTPKAATAKTDNIYFAYSKIKSGTTPSLKYQWIDKNGNVISANEKACINIAGGTKTTGNVSTMSQPENASYFTAALNTASSVAPSLAKDVTGCYIRWIASYVDATDGQTKEAYAYTYVYKPNVRSVSGAAKMENDRGSDSNAATLTWLTGVHSINAASSRYARYGTANDGITGLAPFLSAENNAYIGTSTVSGIQGNAGGMYAVFASTDKTKAYFKANQSGVSVSDNWPGDWSTTNENDSRFDVKSADEKESTEGTSTGDSYNYLNLLVSSNGVINVDTSRYSNLNQIPNLAVGMMVTDNKNCDNGAWIIGDYTGVSDYRSSDNGHNKNSGTNLQNRYNKLNSQTVFANNGAYESYNGTANAEGIKYAGTWNKAISSSSSTYSFKSMYMNTDSDRSLVSSVIDLTVNTTNKSALRQKIAEINSKTAILGFRNGNLDSRYYDTSDETWTAFKNAYNAAWMGLTVVDGSADTAKLIENLENASNALKLNVNSEIATSCEHLFTCTPVAPTCTEKGYNLSTCTKCGYEYKDNYLSALGHSWDSGTITTTPTCTEKGIKTYSCTITGCTETKTEDVSPLGHELVTHEAKAPTCTETGWDSYNTCAHCDYTSYAEKAALGHDYSSEWTVDIPETCTTDGSKSHHCTRCEEKNNDTAIPKAGHCFISTSKTDENGDKVYFCEKCSEYAVPTTGDTFDGFGSYPQTEVTDETLKASLTEKAGSTDNWTSYNYYINGVQSDYMKYTDIELDGEKYRGVYFTSYRPYFAVGTSTLTYQDDNGYNTSTIYWFKFEPILWQILSYDASTDKAVMLSKSVIDSQEYYGGDSTRTVDGKTIYANNYEYSDIRMWLNSAFYNSAFNSDEKAAIEATVLDNSAYSITYSQYNSDNTTDNVWLLSYDESEKGDYGFLSNSERQSFGTDYAEIQGLEKYNNGAYWRLRTAAKYGLRFYSGNMDLKTCGINCNGYDVYLGNCYVYDNSYGIRPALTAHLDYEKTQACSHLFTRTPVAPTCTEKGYNLSTCTKCGFEYKDNFVNALGHDNELLTSTCDCINGGVETYKCTRCNEITTKTYAARHSDTDDDGLCDYCSEPFGGVLDLVFVIDATGSMSGEISVVKNNIQNYADKLAASNIPYYIALVEYSDDSINGGKNHYYNVDFDFTNDSDVIKSGISALSTRRGSYEPVYSAIINGLDELHWGENSAKRIILIGDEEPLDESTLSTGFDYDAALNALTEKEICVYSVATGGTDLEKFKSLANDTNGSYHQSSTDDDFAVVLTDIIDSIPESIHIHDYEITEKTDPTCTKDGAASYSCTGCGKKLKNVVLPATGHTYTSEQRNDNNDSYVLFTCGKCGDTYKIYDPAAAVELDANGIINGITLTWAAAVEPSVTGYKLYRSSSENGEYNLLTSVKGTSYTDKSVEVGTEYFYKIMAVKGSVEGALSDIASAVPLPDTIVPNIKSVTPATYSVISKTVSVKVAATDNVGIVKYEAYCITSDSEEKQMLSTALTNTGCAVSFDTTAVPDGVISFTVAAYDAMNNVSTQTLTYKIDNTGPDTVSAFKTIALHPTQLTLSWEKPLDEDLAYFVLEQKCGENITVVGSKITSLGYNVLNLTPDTEYSYRVKCVDQYGNEGEYTDWITITTTTDTTAPVVTSQSKNSGAYNKSVTYSATVKDDYAVKSVDIEYSYDKITWTKIDGFTYDVDNKTANVSLPIDLTAYNEGSIYIRAVGTDKFGNVGDTSENAPFVEYLIDRTAPEKVDIKSSVVTDKTITVNWNACTSTDVKSYSVYRSTSADGEYKCIASNVKYLNYNDTSVSRNTEYFYKVAAVDNAGNVGELGNYGSSYVYEDAIAPNIASVSPKNTTIGPINKTVSILATDNDNLKNIIIEMKTTDDTDFSVYKTVNVSGTSKTATFDLPLDSFAHGDTVQIRVKAVDAMGLSSDTVTCSYTIDKLAPNADALSVVGNEGNAVVTWNDCGEGDLSGFEIYRCTGTTETRIAGRSVNTSGSYKITDTCELESVRYRVDAVDRYGNKNSFYSVSVSTVVILNPTITLPNTIETESSLTFSASSTKSYYGVSEYKWSFSDGTALTGETVSRKFDAAGSFSVTLTVTDAKGNTKDKTSYFTVKEKIKTGKLKVTITDTNGYAVSGGNVYLDVGSDNVKTIQTSSSGVAVKDLTAGTHEIGAYLDGYLPDTKTVIIENGKTTEVTFKLTKQNIVTGDFNVREMTFEEIKETGIDINNPDNQQIYEVKVTLIYGEQKIPVTYYRTNTEIKHYIIKDSGGTVSNGIKYEYKLKYIPNKQNKEIIAVVRLPIHASYLKQFFLATLTIINNASSDFELVNCTTDITIPDGLTVMERTPISSTIKGGSCDSETLVLRGDTAGEYTLNAKFNGTLKGFNENITASFESNSFKVYDKNTVKLVIEIPEQIAGGKFRFNIGLENNRESDVYCPQINIDGMVADITEMYKKTLQKKTDISDDDIKAIGYNALDSFVRSSDGSVTIYSEKGMPVDKIEPGQGVFIEYETIKELGDGAKGYFNDAIIDIEDSLGGFVEIRYIGTINVDENQYVKEHLDFINDYSYDIASFDIASDMKEDIKNSAEYIQLQILDLDGTLDTWSEEFNSLLGISNEFNDAICADYIEKLIDNATEDSNIELKFFKNLEKIVGFLTDAMFPDEEADKAELSKNKIDSMLKGTNYDSDTNKMLHKLLGKYVDDGTLSSIYGIYDKTSTVLSIYHECDDVVEGIKKLNTYCAAVATYQEISEEIKEILIKTADEVQNKQLKEALQRYTNTAIDEAALKEELRGASKQFFVQNAYDFLHYSYGSILKKSIKKFAVNKLASILNISTTVVSKDLSLSLTLISASRKVLSALSGAKKSRAALYMIVRLSDVTSASAKVLEETKTKLLAARDLESAINFDAAYKTFKQWNLMAYDAYEDYGTAKTENIIAKYIITKNRQNNLDGLADIIATKNIVKNIFCHIQGHEYSSGTSGSPTKVVAVACPVDVKLYAPDGTLAAQVISNVATVYDDAISCMVIEDTKLFAVPSELDYRVEITATGDGTMDYTVMEYSDNTENRKVTFPTQSIVSGDVYTGSTGVNKTEEIPVYALTKNGAETINAEKAIDIIATGISVDKKEISLDIGNTDIVTATVETVGDDSYILYSGDESICTVDENGVITAVGVGKTEIYAASVDGGYIATTTVTVSEHKYDDGKIISAATCTTEGKILYTCTVCSATYTKTEPALGHAYGEWHTKNIPTCTENGTNERVCANNAAHVETQSIPATGHSDNDKDGTCDNCGADLGTNKPSNNCSHMCHNTNKLVKFFWKIFNFFNKLFKIKQNCDCGAKHW